MRPSKSYRCSLSPHQTRRKRLVPPASVQTRFGGVIVVDETTSPFEKPGPAGLAVSPTTPIFNLNRTGGLSSKQVGAAALMLDVRVGLSLK